MFSVLLGLESSIFLSQTDDQWNNTHYLLFVKCFNKR